MPLTHIVHRARHIYTPQPDNDMHIRRRIPAFNQRDLTVRVRKQLQEILVRREQIVQVFYPTIDPTAVRVGVSRQRWQSPPSPGPLASDKDTHITESSIQENVFFMRVSPIELEAWKRGREWIGSVEAGRMGPGSSTPPAFLPSCLPPFHPDLSTTTASLRQVSLILFQVHLGMSGVRDRHRLRC